MKSKQHGRNTKKHGRNAEKRIAVTIQREPQQRAKGVPVLNDMKWEASMKNNVCVVSG